MPTHLHSHFALLNAQANIAKQKESAIQHTRHSNDIENMKLCKFGKTEGQPITACSFNCRDSATLNISAFNENLCNFDW